MLAELMAYTVTLPENSITEHQHQPSTDTAGTEKKDNRAFGHRIGHSKIWKPYNQQIVKQKAL